MACRNESVHFANNLTKKISCQISKEIDEENTNNINFCTAVLYNPLFISSSSLISFSKFILFRPFHLSVLLFFFCESIHLVDGFINFCLDYFLYTISLKPFGQDCHVFTIKKHNPTIQNVSPTYWRTPFPTLCCYSNTFVTSCQMDGDSKRKLT